MEGFDYRLPFKLPSKILKVFGLWQDESSSIYYRVCGTVFHLFTNGLFFVLQFVYLITSCKDVKEVTYVLGAVITYATISLKTFNFMYQLSKIKKLQQMLDKLHQLTKSAKNSERIKLKNQVTSIHKVFKVFLTNCLLAATPGVFILCLYYKEKRFPYRFWVPERYRQDTTWYWMLAFYSNLCTICASFLVAPLDIFPVLFISIGTGLLEELCQRISCIITEADIVVPAPSAPGTSSVKLIKIQEIEKTKINQKKHVNELYYCIKIHQEVQQFVTQTGEVFSSMIFIQGMCCSINMCSVSFHLSLVNFTSIQLQKTLIFNLYSPLQLLKLGSLFTSCFT